MPLFQGLGGVKSPVELFTTNYDTVLEDAIELSSLEVSAGYKGSTSNRRLDLGLWSTGAALPRNKRGLLTKLHGSVNWQRKHRDIHISAPFFSGQHEQHVILYPGLKDTTAPEPFNAFHDRLAWALRQAQFVAFVGFAFRDPLINQILQRDLATQVRVFVSDRRPREQFQLGPLDGRDIEWSSDGFTATVSGRIAHLATRGLTAG